MEDYHHQISEIQKAVREREIHRLQLEKKVLMKTHRREKRYEELQDKIKELHKELIREELEATQRFQKLLTQVDAVRREHQLLAAHTERLRLKKDLFQRQYEMQIANTYPGLQYTGQDDRYHNFQSSGRAGRGIVPQRASTPVSTLPLFRSVATPQPHISPVVSTSHYWSVQPPVNFVPPAQTSPHTYGQQPLNVARPHLQTFGPQGSPNPITDAQTYPETNINMPTDATQRSNQFSTPSFQSNYIKNLIAEESSVSAIRDSSQSGEISQSLSEMQNATIMSHDSSHYNPMHHQELGQTLQSQPLVVHSSRDSISGVPGITPQQAVCYPNYIITQNLQTQQPQLQPSHHNNSLLKPLSGSQDAETDNAMSLAHLTDKETPFLSVNSSHGLSAVPSHNVIHGVPDAMNNSYQSGLQSSFHESFTHITPSVHKLSEATDIDSVGRETGNNHQTVTQTFNTVRGSGRGIRGEESEATQDIVEQQDIIPEEASVEQIPSGTDSQLLQEQQSISTAHNELYTRNENMEQGEESSNNLSARHKLNDNRTKIIETNTNTFGGGSIETISHTGNEVSIEDGELDEKSVHEYHKKSSESFPVHNEVLPTAYGDSSIFLITSNDHSALPNKSNSNNNSSLSPAGNTRNDIVATSTQEQDMLKVSSDTMNPRVIETDVDTLESSAVHINKEATRVVRKDEIKRSPHHSQGVRPSSSVLISPEKLTHQPPTRDKNNSEKLSLTGSEVSMASHSKAASQDQEEDEQDFFDRDIPVTASTAYKNLVGNTRVSAGSSPRTDSESDDVEGHMSAIISQQQTQPTRPTFKPFASSIPSLRPPETDTDSVDSVEAAIQTALKNKKDQPSGNSVPHQSSPPEDTSLKPTSVQAKENIRTGIGGKARASTALQLNLESDSESYGISVGGEEASDEDDFGFYD
ncbi:uncharacterized protein LOC121869174 isoform X1 [Homarus americanus]|uniref:uncharacterized protein LOC121869174 isoform X1 n=1 Tax=Homarus americanus TaxID=6706 RepID=UPI001C445DA8|nr:uncharacterized protein LOC121869174 isoform X1 [Homarus americanus]XP_042226322.1 uncharacterized protein LOC121869174 isoform X1 [Homarus americanus]XP_042226323.1 uncharacterized protein LOC121869174 isoform X1 [Homarus americanus]XP_042226324.1 uncharacterized protein LOC121869174 isoform X1 [Homarus americanus]